MVCRFQQTTATLLGWREHVIPNLQRLEQLLTVHVFIGGKGPRPPQVVLYMLCSSLMWILERGSVDPKLEVGHELWAQAYDLSLLSSNRAAVVIRS